MSQLRLLYVINSLGPGGAEQSLAELLPLYLEGGIRPTIVCLRNWDQGVQSAVQKLGCEVRVLPQGGVASWATAVRRIARDQDAHLIHTTLFWADLVGRLAGARTSVPVLTSLVNTSYDRGHEGDPNVRAWVLRGIRTVDGWTARRLTTHFHAITQAVKNSAVRTLGIPAERITVVERGRDRARLGYPSAERRARARAQLEIPAGAQVVVNVARQEYQKGQKHLLEAFGLLAGERPDLHLLVAGRQGHSTEELECIQQRLGLGDRLRFLGHRVDAPEILAAADVFVFPSVYEGLGGAVIEAMAMGLPVVASDLPALREVVEHGGNALLVQPGSPAALAAAITRVLDDPVTAAAFGARSLRIFEERFTIERSARGMLDLYRRLAGPERARPLSGVLVD